MYTTLTSPEAVEVRIQGDTEVLSYAVRHNFISCEGLTMQFAVRACEDDELPKPKRRRVRLFRTLWRGRSVVAAAVEEEEKKERRPALRGFSREMLTREEAVDEPSESEVEMLRDSTRAADSSGAS